jgi:hypothetical protein
VPTFQEDLAMFDALRMDRIVFCIGYGPAVLMLLACVTSQSPSLSPLPTSREQASRADTVVRRSWSNGLTQEVHLSRNAVRTGDSVVISSTLINRGTLPVRAWSGYPCRLDQIRTTLRSTSSPCMAPSMMVDLRPGESVQGQETLVVASPPGRYAIEIQQAQDSVFTVVVYLQVRSR